MHIDPIAVVAALDVLYLQAGNDDVFFIIHIKQSAVRRNGNNLSINDRLCSGVSRIGNIISRGTGILWNHSLPINSGSYINSIPSC